MDKENLSEITLKKKKKTAVTRQKLQPRYWPAENSQWQRRMFDLLCGYKNAQRRENLTLPKTFPVVKNTTEQQLTRFACRIETALLFEI